MNDRITHKTLYSLCENLNRIVRTNDNNRFFIEFNHGLPRLFQYCKDGVREVSPRLTVNKMYDWLWAFIDGYYYHDNEKFYQDCNNPVKSMVE